MIARPSPNEWRWQKQSVPFCVDDLWDVEWASHAERKDESANASVGKWPAKAPWKNSKYSDSKWGDSTWNRWNQGESYCKPQQPQAIYCVPMVFVMTKLSSSASSFVPCASPRSAPIDSRDRFDTVRAPAATNAVAGGAYADVNKIANIEGPAAFYEKGETDTPQDNSEVDERSAYAGELPSVGSAGHFDGSCKRCAFFPKGRCHNGAECTHCHFEHVPRRRLRNRSPTRARVHHKQVELPDEREDEATQSDDDVTHCQDYGDVGVASATVVSATVAQDNHDEYSKFGSDAEIATMSIPIIHSEPLVDAPAEYGDDEYSKSASDGEVDAPCTLALQSELPADAQTEAEFTTPSPSLSDSEEGTAAFVSDSDKAVCFGSKRMTMHPCSSESSDSEHTMSTASTTASSPKAAQLRKRDGFAPSPMSWAAQQRRRRAESEGMEHSAVDIGRTVRALLNKLTEERFESLCGQILALPVSTPDQLATVAVEIFEKAATENGFRSLYTELCMRLDAHLAAETNAVGGKAFRKALVNECQASFERHLQSAAATSLAKLTGDQFEQAVKLKAHRLGNVRFIGELLVRRLLAPKLIAPIIHELLSGDELALESLVALLTIIAPCFEAKPSLYQAPLKDAFATLRRKQSKNGMSSRLQCQLSDLFDARARGWSQRRT